MPAAQHDTAWVARLAAAFVLAAVLAVRGLRKASLSPSGAIAAFVTGLLHMGCGLTPGFVLIAFYLTSSALTKCRQGEKMRLDGGHKSNGQRDAVQVLSNSYGGCLAAALGMCCQQSRLLPAAVQLPAGRFAAGAFVGFYACCCADTWASEAGILSRRPPRLITTGSVVPPGTNGGVSLLGSTWGMAGGTFIGLLWAALSTITGEQSWLRATAPAWQALPWWAACSTVAGLAGCTVDSLLGATAQYSGMARNGRVVSRPGEGVKHICGRDWLSNDAVNAIASGLTALLTGGAVLALW